MIRVRPPHPLWLGAGLALPGLLVGLWRPRLAGAQEVPVQIAPSSTPPPAPPPPPQGAPPAAAAEPGREDGATGGDSGSQGFFYDDEAAPPNDERQSLSFVGQVPDTHVVRRGDTLWDLCGYYFNNPWEWPKVWSYNPSITNPHWIYPGDVVRLYPAGAGPIAAGPTDAAPTGTGDPGVRMIAGPAITNPSRSVELRQVAFVDDKELDVAGTVVGSPEEKELLTAGDEIYLDYPEGKPPQLGQRYAIYSETKKVIQPKSKKVVGSYITLRGEVKIVEVKKDRKARGILTYTNDIVERGMRVGPTRTQFKEVAPVAPERDLEGAIVGLLTTDQLGGQSHVVFIDRGREEGVEVGNQLVVVRRGDAYETEMGPKSAAGRDDRRYPEDGLGLIIVVEAGPHSAVAFVVRSNQEFEIGDHVVMRKPK
jgi:hypothetical protein